MGKKEKDKNKLGVGKMFLWCGSGKFFCCHEMYLDLRLLLYVPGGFPDIDECGRNALYGPGL